MICTHYISALPLPQGGREDRIGLVPLLVVPGKLDKERKDLPSVPILLLSFLPVRSLI